MGERERERETKTLGDEPMRDIDEYSSMAKLLLTFN